MKTYWAVFLTSLQNNLTYRASFFLGQIRQFLSFLVSLFVWQFVFTQTHSLYHYSIAPLMTYVFLSLLLKPFIFDSRTFELANIINQGDLSLYLLKPINIFRYYLSRDFAFKVINFFFLLLELPLLYFIFKPPLLIQANGLILFHFFLYALVALLSYFYLSFVLGCLGFWTKETWAPRFLLFVILEFAVGGIFPLDMLPHQLNVLIALSPFSHLLFFPVKTYLGSDSFFTLHFLIALAWLVIFYFLAKLVWFKGLKHYEAEGR